MKSDTRNTIIVIAVAIVLFAVSYFVLSAVLALILRLVLIAAIVCGIAYLVLPREKRDEYVSKLMALFGKNS